MHAILDLYQTQAFWMWVGVAALLLAIEALTGSGYLLWPAGSAGVVAALTLGQLGMSTPESPTFINQLHQVWCPCPAAPPAARCQGGQRCAAGV